MADSMRAIRLAQKDGFLRAEHMINWNGYEVYTPVQNDEECRWATIEEYDTIMFSFSEEEIEGFMNGQS